jgi:hypothetical protein
MIKKGGICYEANYTIRTFPAPETTVDGNNEGKRMKNGWKNSGLPWTYKINPEKMRLPMYK